MDKFRDSIDELQAKVKHCGLDGDWRLHTKQKFYQFRAKSGEVLNWWPGTGTVNFQGENPERFRDRFFSDGSTDTSGLDGAPRSDVPVWISVPALGEAGAVR
jgi:hypothetical protein